MEQNLFSRRNGSRVCSVGGEGQPQLDALTSAPGWAAAALVPGALPGGQVGEKEEVTRAAHSWATNDKLLWGGLCPLKTHMSKSSLRLLQSIMALLEQHHCRRNYPS